MKRRGFTLLETLVAAAVLATVGAASLKLVILAQNTLAAVDEKERLLDAAREIETGILAETLDDRGTSGDVRWETEEKEAEYFGEDFGRLSFEELDFDAGARRPAASETIRVKWRETAVRDAKCGGITVYLQSEEEAEKEPPSARGGNAEEGEKQE